MDMAIPFFIATVLLGLIYGSFATALIHRVPAGISWSFSRRNGGETPAPIPRSACPHCGATLQAIDLVPVFSWLYLRGRCRRCQAPISWTYPAIELATALACVGIELTQGFTPQTLVLMTVMPFLVALAVIDLRIFMLPNVLNAAVAVLWLPFTAAGLWQGQNWHDTGMACLSAVAAAIIYGGLAFALAFFMRKALQKEALGMGDIKFFAIAGLWLGLSPLPYFLMLAGILGVILGVGYRILAKSVYFPFGPSLIATFYILLVFHFPGIFP